MKKVLITVGLPASGKSTFAKQYYSKKNKAGYYSRSSYLVCHLNFDELLDSFKYNKFDKPEAIEKILKDELLRNNCDEIILDGLFLCTDDVIKILSQVKKRYDFDLVEIHFWKPNIDNCLWNDRYRREKNSEITIKNAKIEIPDVEKIKNVIKGVNVEMIKHDVEKKPEWMVFANKYEITIDENNKTGLHSDSWSLGGTWGDCWGNKGNISSEPQPTSYEEFDNLMMKVCQNITFLQYKKLYNQSVSVETYSENDYYGGHTERAYFICDIEQLYDELVNLGLIEL